MSEDTYIVTRDEIAEMEGLAKIHFLNPNARRLNKSLGDVTGLTGLGVHIIEVAPGDETTEHHVHHQEDECLYVLNATATATIGDEKHIVNAGDFIGFRKGGLPHSMRNTGEETLRCIVVGQRLDHDVADYTLVQKRIYRNVGMDWNLVDHDAISKPVAGAKK